MLPGQIGAISEFAQGVTVGCGRRDWVTRRVLSRASVQDRAVRAWREEDAIARWPREASRHRPSTRRAHTISRPHQRWRTQPVIAGPASAVRRADAVPPAGRRARHVGRSRSSHVPRFWRRGAAARSAGSPLVAEIMLHVACPQQATGGAHVQRLLGRAVDPVRHASASPPRRKRGRGSCTRRSPDTYRGPPRTRNDSRRSRPRPSAIASRERRSSRRTPDIVFRFHAVKCAGGVSARKRRA